MISKLLIANRGEIACRVMRTASALGIKTVAIYSEADRNAMHVKMADEAIYVGAAPSSESYLRGEFILSEALKHKVDAIHPGYGFLSENAGFAEMCAKQGIIFVGPDADAIRAMGSKSKAKQIMQDAGVPLVPGYHGDEQSPDYLLKEAQKIGFPVLLKAAAGGGGKGMRVVHSESAFTEELEAAKRESQSSFGDQHMLVEKYLTQPRHVEIQVFCDNHQNAVYLFERDCSVQRRHQKILEEAPAPRFDDNTRKAMGETAIKAALAIGYKGAGTVEFLYDSDGSFYFMEMNTRLQVEHPVTEMITGLDLVAWQIDVANGKVLAKQQNELTIKGHAIEARIYAEDPDNSFLPSTGVLRYLDTPENAGNAIRIDTGVSQGDEVSVFYDPMIAKLIAYADDRETALKLLTQSLQKFCIAGVKTNISYLLRVAQSGDFKIANLTTNFVEQHKDELGKALPANDFELTAAILVMNHQRPIASPFSEFSNLRLNHQQARKISIKETDQEHIAELTFVRPGYSRIKFDSSELFASYSLTDDEITLTTDSHQQTFKYSKSKDEVVLFGDNGPIQFDVVHDELGDDDLSNHSDEVLAPMNGTIVDILVKKGQSVEKDQAVAVIEAMKMEQTLRSPRDGVIQDCFFNAGDRIDGGAPVLILEPKEE